jgi:hypothetical protein
MPGKTGKSRVENLPASCAPVPDRTSEPIHYLYNPTFETELLVIDLSVKFTYKKKKYLCIVKLE